MSLFDEVVPKGILELSSSELLQLLRCTPWIFSFFLTSCLPRPLGCLIKLDD